MQSILRLRGLLTLLGLAAFLTLGCHGNRGHFEPGPDSRDVYLKTGMHAIGDKTGVLQIASTNFLEGDSRLACGTRLRVHEIDSESMSLTGDAGQRYRVHFVRKHSLMSFEDWRARQFSDQPIELPGDLSDLERRCIEECRVEPGISRSAMFLAVGYPPASLSADPHSHVLKYQARRFDRRQFEFDTSDHLVAVHE